MFWVIKIVIEMVYVEFGKVISSKFECVCIYILLVYLVIVRI